MWVSRFVQPKWQQLLRALLRHHGEVCSAGGTLSASFGIPSRPLGCAPAQPAEARAAHAATRGEERLQVVQVVADVLGLERRHGRLARASVGDGHPLAPVDLLADPFVQVHRQALRVGFGVAGPGRVLDEALRLHPPVEVAPECSLVLVGERVADLVPVGVPVLNIFLLLPPVRLRRRIVFGEPEVWLVNDEERVL